MAANRFTPEQQAALDATGKVIVSASAGSGKTTVMIRKILDMVQAGCDVRDILAVTFTKKAAGQMKEKLSKSLVETINLPTTSQETRQRLKKQLLEVPNADISTIHSFCAKLIRSNFFLLETENDFRVIGGDDAEGKSLKSEALDELFDLAYESKDEEFMHLLSVYWRKKSDNAMRRLFLTTYETIRSRADYRSYLEKSGNYDEVCFDKVCDDLFTLLKEKCQYYSKLVEKELRYFGKTEDSPAQVELADQLICGLEQIANAKDYFSASLVEKPQYARKKVSKKDSEEKKLHIEKLAFLKEKIVKIYDKELMETPNREEALQAFLRSAKTAKALAKYLLLFDDKYTQKKRERKVLDYNDLEHKTLLLLQNEETVKELREKYRYVFVDEYQDVNPVQEAIIDKISGENVFLVGDVKQSIYGFRGSKSKYFVEKQHAFGSGAGKSLMMTRNFRSSDAVLDAVNEQFALAMTKETGVVEYNDGSWMERGGAYEVGSGRVEVHFLGEEPKEKAEERGVYSVAAKTGKRETKESRIVKRIRHIIEKERLSTFYDIEKGEYRNVEYKDIAILSRKKQGEIAETVAALSDAGIPVCSAASVNVCDYAEVKRLIDFMSLLDNVEQDIPLCSVLLSPIGGVTAQELTHIRLTYKKEPFFRNAIKRYAQEHTNTLAEKLQSFYTYFENVRMLSNVLDAGELLTKVVAETRMETELLSHANGGMCLKRIRRFIEESVANEPLSVHEFLKRLKDLDYRIEYNESSGDNSVKVLTMHASKGLEYPIVILDNLSQPFRAIDHDEVFVEEKYGLAPRAFDTKNLTRQSTLLRRLHEKKEELSTIADDLNLFYVAMTRAKYGLHMLFNERTIMPNVRYATSFADFVDFSVWEKYVSKENVFDLPKQARQPLAFKPDETLTQGIMEAFLWEYPYKNIENIPVKSSATALLDGSTFSAKALELEEKSDNEIVIEAERSETGEDSKQVKTSTDIGLAYHAFLENFDFSKLYLQNGGRVSKEELENVVECALADMMKKAPVAAAYLSKEKLVEILCNPVFYELRDMRLYKEQKFLASLPVLSTYAKKQGIEPIGLDSDEEIIFQGAIDLLAVGEDEIRIIDYKYSLKNAAALKEHYRLQLELYRQAVAKVMKVDEENIRCTIVNICHGFQVDVE